MAIASKRVRTTRSRISISKLTELVKISKTFNVFSLYKNRKNNLLFCNFTNSSYSLFAKIRPHSSGKKYAVGTVGNNIPQGRDIGPEPRSFPTKRFASVYTSKENRERTKQSTLSFVSIVSFVSICQAFSFFPPSCLFI